MDFIIRGAAADLFDDTSPEVCIVGAAGTGKTVAALMKLHVDSLDTRAMQSLVVRQTHASLVASTLVAFEQFVAREALESGAVKWFGGSGSKPAGYYYPNGSTIMVGGMDNPGKVLSMNLDRVVVDEANQVSVTAYETLLTRLRGSAATYKQIVCATNPDHPEHWLKTRADDPEQQLRMYTSRHADNPYLADRHGQWTEAGESYVRFLESLTGVRRLRYLNGVWAAAEGMVYGDWREDVNVIEWFEVPADWGTIVSIDFGFNNAFSLQVWRIDPDGRMYLTHEWHQSGKLVEDWARDLKAWLTEQGLRPNAIVCDHDAEDRATLERHLKLPTLPARKGVSRGVQLVESRIRKAGDGRPRLYVFRNALQGRDPIAEERKTPRGVAKEVLGYVWETIRGTDGVPKEVPKKLNDHAMDCLRYAVAHLDWHEDAKVGNPAKPREIQPSTGSSWSRPVGR